MNGNFHLWRLRKATIHDRECLFQWRNDAVTRANSLSKVEISWNEHLTWLNKALQSSDRFLYIFESPTHEPLGCIRADREVCDEKEQFRLSWTIAPKMRGKGLGKEMVLAFLSLPFLQGKKVVAYIKKGNIASRRIAEACHFHFHAESDGLEEWQQGKNDTRHFSLPTSSCLCIL